jgi:hypothetical protein
LLSPPKVDTFPLSSLLVLPFSLSFKIRPVLLFIVAYLFSAFPALLLPISAVMPNKIYKKRTPEKSVLYKIVYLHFQEYENIYPDKHEKQFGFLRKIIVE